MKELRKLIALSLAVFIILGLAACGNNSIQENELPENTESKTSSMITGKITPNENTIVIQVGHVNPSNEEDHLTQFIMKFSDLLMEKTSGKYAAEVMGNSQLGGDRDMLEGLNMGMIDAALITNMVVANTVPSANVLELPYMFDNDSEAFMVAKDSLIFGTIHDDLYNNYNIYLSGHIGGGFRNTISTKKDIKSMDDMKDFKIRVPEGNIFTDTFKSLGAAPTAMAFSETITSVQQGVIDGLEIPIASIYSGGYYNFCKYIVATNHIYTTSDVCFSRKFWDSLSKEDQKLFNEAVAEAAEYQIEYIKSREENLIEKMKENGAVYTEVDMNPFVEATVNIRESYRDIIGAEVYDRAIELLNKARADY